ncbi:MAG: hypothetical protein HQK50_07895 [Oligoflexia bacterium]|nr:hypothetical protein [Oligoflexia bacterium]MBF0365479.1 hypothetical protein [Oligoflexia bacterium]
MCKRSVSVSVFAVSMFLLSLFWCMPMSSAKADVGINSFVGTWVGANEVFPKLVIEAQGERNICVYLYVKCNSSSGLCGLDGSEVTCVKPQLFYSRPRDDRKNVATMMIERVYSFKKYRIQLSVENGKLRLQDFSVFTDGSERTSYTWLFYFTKDIARSFKTGD